MEQPTNQKSKDLFQDIKNLKFIKLSDILESEENPNEQDERTFNQLVENIKSKGFDEPIIVQPIKDKVGKYRIVSGHHRYKAIKMLGYNEIPCIIKNNYTEYERKTDLVSRNVLRGKLNKAKFTTLWDLLGNEQKDEVIRMNDLGITEKKLLDDMIVKAANSLPAKQKQKLNEAKENIKTIDDLAKVIHTIFKEHGSQLDYGFMVFTHYGKNHHYIKTNDELDKILKDLEKQIEAKGLNATEVFTCALKNVKI
jgi:ParB/RepB/Spo0J family partition protein